MTDIVFDNLVFDRLREIGDQSQRIGELEAEIARLRLTDAERSAIRDAADRYASLTPESVATAATLRGLLERLGPTGSEDGHTNLGIRENGIAQR